MTLASFSSYLAAMSLTLVGVSIHWNSDNHRASTHRSAVRPFDVIESAVDVTAFLPRRAFVAELRPYRLVVVEMELRLRHHVGEKGCPLQLLHCLDLLVRVDGGEISAGGLVQLRQAVADSRRQLRRARHFLVDRFHDHPVVLIAE